MPKKQSKRNAILMAAGMSSRLVPLSFEKAKPLTIVRGEVLIERLIRQMQEADIQEIVVVVGYLKEQFEYLVDKYGVILIENPNYNTRNTHASIYCAKDYFKNTVICPGDEYFTENVFLEPSETSYYALDFSPEHVVGEWCPTMTKDGLITDITFEGENCWIMVEYGSFIEEDSAKMIPLLKKACANDDDYDLFWEDVWLPHMKEIPLYGRKYKKGVVQDLDTLSMLQEFDDKFMDTLDCKVLNKICKALGGLVNNPVDVQNCTPIIVANELVGMNFTVNEDTFEYIHKEQVMRNQKTKETWVL